MDRIIIKGLFHVESIESDMDVDFGLVHIPTSPLLPIGPSEKLPEEVHPFPPGTGIKSLSNVYKVSIMISGVIIAVILLKKKDEKESK